MNEFQVAKDGVDPNLVPQRVLNTGAKMPAIGLGTFGSDRFSGEDIAEAVKGAISIGYRHIDCASIYGNENLIGQSLKEVMQGGIKRQELWVTSKLWNDMHSEGDVLISCKKSLEDLQLDYLNLYLVHWPFPNYHPPGCDVTSRSPNAKPYIHENYMKTWRQMEKLVEMGLAKHIGTSNMTIPKLKLLLRDANIKPACNEMEQHPHFQQPELFQFCMENNFVLSALLLVLTEIRLNLTRLTLRTLWWLR
jgi:diketogulonate reductase-like aldo/keto reductase